MGVVVGVAVVLAVGEGVAWHVYKKRKCKKRVSKGEYFNLYSCIIMANIRNPGRAIVIFRYFETAVLGNCQSNSFVDVRCSPESLHHTLINKYH